MVVKHTRASCELPFLDKVLWRALDDNPECLQCRTTRHVDVRTAVGSKSFHWHPPPSWVHGCMRRITKYLILLHDKILIWGKA